MAIGSLDKAGRLAQVRDYARCLIWSGYLRDERVRAEVLEAVAAEERDPRLARHLAARMVDELRAELVEQSADWAAATDVDRLMTALDDLRARDIVVLEAVDDHWAAEAALEARRAAGNPPAGIAYFTLADVWHSVANGMLELNVWHADTANVAPGDELLDLVLGVLHSHGIGGHFDEGRIEADVWWRRRPGEGNAPSTGEPQ